ncbi:Uma2 family endonuclease [Desulfofundulus thermobenzoicus]|uniref:Uma2 family endonuclease n=1 Tax=Desulfofundulus thermobenzoicus TaxID=29376 RepID=A0A6N7IQ15_9FIRM|nr:Uma2 family endonuclease [Desulfofundulus thermobenzoicus]MQL52122.1 Uma2 family endonuclease [Desulfofundulus thermobenzoicus]HHW42264.1 Uma2 family endonuclease [Desulfotomaculum sp.]
MSRLKETAAVYETRPLPEGKITFEEFLAWCDEDTWAEWVDGEVVILTPAARKHQKINALLSTLLREFVLRHNLGDVLTAPFLVRLPETLRRGREPDILYVSNEKLPLLKETYMDGSPDLIVEITSPESLARDRGEKYVEYEAAGVKEYWLIDPDRRQAEFYRLGEKGRYRTIHPDDSGIYRSEAIPGFWLQVGWLWQEPLPSAIDCLKEMGLI